MSLALYAVVFYVLAAFAVFWIIRLAVRCGMDDALRRNRSWLERPVREPSARESARDE